MNNKKTIVVSLVALILFIGSFLLSCKYFGEEKEEDLIEVSKENVVEASILGVGEDTYEYLKSRGESLRERILSGEGNLEKEFLEIKTGTLKRIRNEGALVREKYLLYELYSSNLDYKLFKELKYSSDVCSGLKDIYDYRKRALDSLNNIEMALDGDFEFEEALEFEVDKDFINKCRNYLVELEVSIEAMEPLRKGFYNEMMEELDLSVGSKLERQLLEASKYSVRHYMAYSLGEDVSVDSGKFLDISKELLDRAKLLIYIMEE